MHSDILCHHGISKIALIHLLSRAKMCDFDAEIVENRAKLIKTSMGAVNIWNGDDYMYYPPVKNIGGGGQGIYPPDVCL